MRNMDASIIWPILGLLVTFIAGHFSGWLRAKTAIAKVAGVLEAVSGCVSWLSEAIKDDKVTDPEWDKGFEELKKLAGVIKG